MRLIRCVDRDALELVEYLDDETPPYAILSHTWGKEEITFQQFQGSTDELKGLAGFRKIQNACNKARRLKLNFVWVDTCCIDKKSSAELSEAINSMFRFYQRAKVCLAFLEDVRNPGSAEEQTLMESEFAKSRWFTRGWTLQELIAPRHIEFYAADWRFLGSKAETFSAAISRITGIDGMVLRNPDLLRDGDICIANKMAWASGRHTSRVEDMAYCLLGLFDVNMPLIYGERDKAFIRLQEEIIRVSDDQSIFAHDQENKILATDPIYFRGGARIVKAYDKRYSPSESFTMTHRGLHIQLPLVAIANRIYQGILQCRYRDD
ncbi:HET-domain-containing protein, partial [Rhizodiscina lignyota]